MRRFALPVVLVLTLSAALTFGTGTQETSTAQSGAGMASGGSYQEAPMLAALVAAGELPPVDERLPDEPPVLSSMALVDPQIGRYGGTLQVFALDNYPWQDMTEMPERGGRMVRITEDGKMVPEVVKGFAISADKQSYTFTLHKGMKWSDGAPFTADDFIFRYEDMFYNEKVEKWQITEPLSQVTKVDDYTIRFEFEEPFPKFMSSLISWRGGEWGRFAPKHYLMKWHINHNENADALAKEEGFDSWWEAFNHHYQIAPAADIDKPTLQPWMFTEFTSTYRDYERNPYYYAVDAAGNQLPYIDRIISTIIDSEVYQLKIMSGEADMAIMNTSFENYPLYKENEEQGGYRVTLVAGRNGSEVPYFLNQNHPDPVLREIFQDVRFRRALSLAINRDEINESVFFGVAVPRQATLHPGASFYKPEWGEEHPYARYDPAAAQQLLDEMGLTERDQEGFRKRPDGKTALLIIEYPTSMTSTSVTVHELVKEYWEDVGLKVLLKPEEYALAFERMEAGEHEILSETEIFRKELREYNISPETIRWGSKWHLWLDAEQAIKDGRQTLDEFEGGNLPGEEPPQKIKDLFALLVQRYNSEYGSQEYLEVSEKIFDFYAEELLIIGTVGLAPTVYTANANLGNTIKGDYTIPGSPGGVAVTLGKFLFFKN